MNLSSACRSLNAIRQAAPEHMTHNERGLIILHGAAEVLLEVP
jgi:hypothetical protein